MNLQPYENFHLKYEQIQDDSPGCLGPTSVVRIKGDPKLYMCKAFRKRQIGTRIKLVEFMHRIEDISNIQEDFVIKYIDGFEDNKYIYLIRPRIEGTSLSEYITNNGPMNLEHGMALWTAIMKCYANLHSHKFYPFSIKPSNVFIDSQAGVYIVDLYKPLYGIEGLALPQVIYLAPEYLTIFDEPGPKADVWALGIILVVILGGTIPWITSNFITTLRGITQSEVNPPTNLPEAVSRIICAIFRQNPNQRPMISDLLHPHPGDLLHTNLDEKELKGAKQNSRSPSVPKPNALQNAAMTSIINALTTSGNRSMPTARIVRKRSNSNQLSFPSVNK